MRRPRARWLALTVLLTTCGGEPRSDPPAILYGADSCDRCRMVISEERHAAAARVGERELRFDDPGCLRAFLAADGNASVAVAWVHDERETWRRLEEAWFAVDPEGGTPMASGILAFRSREAAEASPGDGAIRWDEIADRSD